MIKFNPATTLPVTFNFAGASSGEVLIWDGNEVSATATPPKSTLMSLSDVNDDVVAITNDVLTFTGGRWQAAVSQGAGGSSIDLTNFMIYDYAANTALDAFWNASVTTPILGANVETVWAKEHIKSFVSNARGGTFSESQEKATIPNAITSFGLGMFGAMEWTRAAMGLLDGVLPGDMFDTWFESKTSTSGIIHAAMEWNLSKGVGRNWGGETPTAGLNGSPYYSIDDVLQLTTSKATVSRAFYEELTVSGVAREIKRIKLNNIDQATGLALYSKKCNTSGIQSHKLNSGSTTIRSGEPEVDHYLNSLKNAVSLANWTDDNNWGLDHPLMAISGKLDYTDGIKEAFQADYTYSSLQSTATKAGGTYNANQQDADWFTAQLNMPSVITYFLGTLYDSDLAAGNADNTTRTVPTVLEWKGNIESIINPDLFTSKIGGADEFYTTRQFLRTVRGGNERAGSYWYFHKWFIKSAGSSEADSTWTPEFNPFDGSHYQDSGSDTTYLRPSYDDGNIDVNTNYAYNAGYSFLIESNKVFSWFLENSPPMYDEYVFKVTMKNACPSGTYQVITDVHEYVDGCSQLAPEGTVTAGKRVGDTDCANIGGTNEAADGTFQSGYHLWPADFHPDYVSIWNQVDFSKIKAFSRNHTATTFELVLKIPRFVRIGMIDRYYDANGEGYYTGSGTSAEIGPLSIEHMADNFTATDWSDDTDGSGDGNPPNNNARGITEVGSDTAGSGLLIPNTIASVSTESAIQYIRLGIPANMMLKFAVIPNNLTIMDMGE